MELVHRVLAYAAVMAVGIGVGWWVLRALRPTMDGRFLDRFGVGVVVLFLAADLVGATQLASGARPNEGLHLLPGEFDLPCAQPRTDRPGDRHLG